MLSKLRTQSARATAVQAEVGSPDLAHAAGRFDAWPSSLSDLTVRSEGKTVVRHFGLKQFLRAFEAGGRPANSRSI
jgi:hypothetical protein